MKIKFLTCMCVFVCGSAHADIINPEDCASGAATTSYSTLIASSRFCGSNYIINGFVESIARAYKQECKSDIPQPTESEIQTLVDKMDQKTRELNPIELLGNKLHNQKSKAAQEFCSNLAGEVTKLTNEASSSQVRYESTPQVQQTDESSPEYINSQLKKICSFYDGFVGATMQNYENAYNGEFSQEAAEDNVAQLIVQTGKLHDQMPSFPYSYNTMVLTSNAIYKKVYSSRDSQSVLNAQMKSFHSQCIDDARKLYMQRKAMFDRAKQNQ